MKMQPSLKILFTDTTNSFSLTSALKERFGFDLRVITNLDQALQAINERSWDIVIFSAYQVSSQQILLLHTLRQQSALPLILLTDKQLPPATLGDIIQLSRNIPVSDLVSTMFRLRAPAPEAQPPSFTSLADRAKLTETHNTLLDRMRELDALLEIGKTVTSLLDVDAILRKVVSAAVTLTKAEEGYLLLADQETGDLYLRAEQNLEESQARDFQLKTSDSIAGEVLQSGQPILLSHDNPDIKIKTGYTVHALINAPIIFGGAVLGVLGVANQQIKRSFGENELRVMKALADWAAIALTNARLFREARRGSKSTEPIYEISRSILSSLRVEEIPHKLIQHTTEIIGAECGSLALVDEEKDELAFLLAYDIYGQEIKEMRNLTLPMGQGVIGAVAADGQPRIVHDVHKNQLWYSDVDDLTGFTTEEVLAVPLKAEGFVIGVVELLNKRDASFDQNDQELLMAVASAAAIAIQNARQFEALEQAHQKLREAQKQRIASEQWSILGRATGNLAHRIHNTTTIVPLAVQDLKDLLSEVEIPDAVKEDVEANLNRIERNVTYTIHLADSLMRRFRHEPTAAYDVNQAIKQALAQVELPDDITLTQTLSKDLAMVDSSSLLTDAIVELINNAIKAMPDGGELIIKSLSQEKLVKINISDTGIGISPERQDKIFSLFYSDALTGLGFGLWWVKTFLQQYGGEIDVASQPTIGSTFTIGLPVLQEGLI